MEVAYTNLNPTHLFLWLRRNVTLHCILILLLCIITFFISSNNWNQAMKPAFSLFYSLELCLIVFVFNCFSDCSALLVSVNTSWFAPQWPLLFKHLFHCCMSLANMPLFIIQTNKLILIHVSYWGLGVLTRGRNQVGSFSSGLNGRFQTVLLEIKSSSMF